MLIEFQIKLF